MTNISLRVGHNDRNINIQCHAVNQEVADTKVQSHTVSVLCKYFTPHCQLSAHSLLLQTRPSRPASPATAEVTSCLPAR